MDPLLEHKSQIQSIEVSCLVRQDKICNETIKTSHKIKPAKTNLEEHKLRRFGHLHRMDHERPKRPM